MQTVEEAVREWVIEHGPETASEFVATREAFKAGVEFAQRWIPVEEELPKAQYDGRYSNEVLVMMSNEKYIVAWYDYKYNKWEVGLWCEDSFTVTHWRPITLK